MADGPRSMSDNLAPYAGGETRPHGATAGSTARKEGIPEKDKHSAAQDHPMPREDIEGYAPKGEGNSAMRAGGDCQVGDPNTARGTHSGPMIDTAREGPGDGESSLDRPLSPDPYANTSTTSAGRRDAEGL